nr:MAG TPA: hypothetical protein [Caudoviricetes sp.]
MICKNSVHIPIGKCLCRICRQRRIIAERQISGSVLRNLFFFPKGFKFFHDFPLIFGPLGLLCLIIRHLRLELLRQISSFGCLLVEGSFRDELCHIYRIGKLHSENGVSRFFRERVEIRNFAGVNFHNFSPLGFYRCSLSYFGLIDISVCLGLFNVHLRTNKKWPAREKSLVDHTLSLLLNITLSIGRYSLFLRPVFYLSGNIYNDDSGPLFLDLCNSTIFENRFDNFDNLSIQQSIAPPNREQDTSAPVVFLWRNFIDVVYDAVPHIAVIANSSVFHCAPNDLLNAGINIGVQHCLIANADSVLCGLSPPI